ncbi:UDP-N-acetylmuramoyl-tripeptide--D-alanyl-D-alanine ligase [hydrothermal vent metagenome]|uniref:UDP-MurNAc-pentapeptide synthetase n=1 Tax=hydrothermal vent metagenome TaxID=652676 RepID=A0A3B0WCH2_9ZZZZ
MISMNLHQAAAMTGGTLVGKPTQFRGVITDSRQDCTGKLFIGLKGDNFNGENYCSQAIDNGAVAVLVSCAQDVTAPQLICEHSLTALSVLAKNWAKQCQVKIIAITGSNGKTTVKNMLKSIFSLSGKCVATQGNLNNEIGVPLTLCNIHVEDKYAVIEMGAAKLGDISWLVSLVNIHTAVLTNASPAHIGRFGSLENIVTEKGKIIANLTNTAFAVLPFDDDNFKKWSVNTHGQVLSFGFKSGAKVQIENKAGSDQGFNLIINDSTIADINLPVAGVHNHLNAACAAAVASSFGLFDEIKPGLESFAPASGRLENLGKIAGHIVINDSYNANPQSVKAAIDVLAQYSNPVTLVLGDMAELGNDSQKLHIEIGKYAKSHNITHLLTVGTDSQYASQAFADTALHFDNLDALTSYLLKNWQDLGTTLVKGSRSMHLEDLINSIVAMEKVA